jgi:hypothetical protein
MSVGLRSYPESVRMQVAGRRERAGTSGLGYWGARDAIKKYKPPSAEKRRPE